MALTLARPAAATYSIVAADTATRQVGGAGTSCIGGADVYVIYGSVPGIGAVHAQASLNYDGRDRAVERLEQGLAPLGIIDEITSFDFDSSSGSRQYGIADVMGRTAGFTGNSTTSYADDRQGQIETFSYSVQGNILTGQAVLSQAAAAFEGTGCDLADRLMLALEAGAENGEGDSRCTDDGIPSDSAFLQVDRQGEAAGDWLSLRVPSSGSENPLIELRAEYEEWRSAHPCPELPADAGAAGTGGSAGSAGNSGSSSGVGGTLTAGGTGPSGGAGTPSADAGLDSSDAPPAAGETGCTCTTPARSASSWASLVFAVACALLRTRRASRCA